MSSPDDAISYVFMWHSLSDACEKCRHLNGREWRDQDLFQQVLWDPIWGNLWNLDTDQKLTHPNCRCQLEVRVEFDWSKWEEFQELQETIGLFGILPGVA